MARLTLYVLTFLALAGGCCPLFASTAPGTPPNVTIVYSTATVTPTLVPLNATTCGGGKIAFVGMDGESKRQLYVMNADGSELRKLTSITYGISPDARITWSPDGQQIAFVAGNIYIINSDSSGLHKLTHVNYTLSDPSWSPDGKKVAFSASGTESTDIFTINADGSDLKQITHSKNLNEWAANFDPFWSPDSKQIAYTSQHSQPNDFTSGIYTMNADGTDEQSLVQDVGPSTKAWSPDGNYIMFDLYGPSIDVINLHEHTYTKLILNGYGPSFSPNGHCLLFENNSRLYLATPDGSNIQPLPTRLPATLEIDIPVWGR